MTKTLTKQWREGTLSLNYYYIKLQSGKYGIDHTVMSIDGDLPKTKFAYSNFAIEEVLAPVPSYDEYKRLVSNSDESVQKIHILEKQIADLSKKVERLQEQLESAQDVIYEYIKIYGVERECSKYLEKYAERTK